LNAAAKDASIPGDDCIQYSEEFFEENCIQIPEDIITVSSCSFQDLLFLSFPTMAAFEDNNPFASPASPTSSRANSYAPFGSYPYSSQHNAQLSIDSTNRPATSSSEDAPAYQFRATNSDFSVEQNQVTVQGSGGGPVTGSRDKEGETCCKIDEIFRKNPEMRIVISEAGKASDGGANFIAYTIEVAV
jgi:hypothetical protein